MRLTGSLCNTDYSLRLLQPVKRLLRFLCEFFMNELGGADLMYTMMQACRELEDSVAYIDWKQNF